VSPLSYETAMHVFTALAHKTTADQPRWSSHMGRAAAARCETKGREAVVEHAASEKCEGSTR